MKICRFCRQEIDAQARRCAHCQADVSLLGRFKPLVTALIAVGGIGFGLYEQHLAQGSQAELKHEQDALVKVLGSVPESELAHVCATELNEEQARAEVKKNPKNYKARNQIARLKGLAQKRRNSNKAHVAGQKTVRMAAGKTPPRTANNRPRGNAKRR